MQQYLAVMRLQIRNLCLVYAQCSFQTDDVTLHTSSIEELPLPVDEYDVDMHEDVKKKGIPTTSD